VEIVRNGAQDAPSYDIDVVNKVLDQIAYLDDIRPVMQKEVPLPREYKSLYGMQIEYTMARRLTQDTINRQKLGYCDTGPYAGFLIIPDVDPAGRIVYWMGRNMFGKKPKTKNPPKELCNVGSGERLFNYYRATQYPSVVLTEGWADALRVGDDAVATYGVGIKGKQLALLIMGGFRTVTVMWDADVSTDTFIDTGRQLESMFEVKIARLPEADPDSYTRSYLRNIIEAAPKLPSRVDFLNPPVLAG
jgi:hypothetical protein